MNEEDLSKFTDLLDEIGNSQPFEVCDSQPLSLLSSSSTPIHQGDADPLPKSNRPPKCTGQRGNFRSVEEIDPKYRHIFSYRYFNLVQSSVIEDGLYSNKSIVVSAPTGSGKTVVFEMAIVQLLMELEDRNYAGDFKIIYMAPIKALCTERLTEWHSKFTKLGLLCIEVTGDTDVEFSQLQPYRIIITTPEKWDMLTRRWKDHRGLVEVVKLFLIDEVHILNDEMRGPVLEAVVSRMKTIETSVQSAHRIEQLQAQFQGADPQRPEPPPRIRFVAVSATVSNPEDVAAWLGNSEKPAAYYKFGDECRPVKLNRVVEGYLCPPGTSTFKFDIMLNYKLWPIIRKYHNGKPTLIFCNTRKGVLLTAETLSREITVTFSQEQKDILAALASTVKNKKVQSLILCGIGCHHAGLLYEERSNIEQAFRNRDLPILITTTTLAMGVNLPAHLVIIKNTQQYVNGAYQEYSISTVLQMVGRAGRPQYDTEATAVIMTRPQDKARYQALVGGCEPLQSYLHKRLAENLNSEAALGTVSDVAQCVQWVNSTFLSVRAGRDPRRYLNLPPAAPAELITQKIEELCVRAMNGLASAGLITMDELSCIESTEAGRLMSLYYLDLETMKLIMQLEGTESLEQLLRLVCESHELADMHLRVDERRCLNALNRNSAAATIRFPMRGKINSRQMKLSCIIQAVLGCLPIPDPSLNQEAMKIIRTADRVCKCIVSYVTRHSMISQNPKFFAAVLNSLILAKCISSQLWENSPYVSRQLKGIGPAYSALLASAGKTTFMVLEESHPRDLERIMNKGPPTGNMLRKQISLLPKYNLTMTPVNERVVRIQLTLMNQAYLAENIADLTAGINHKSYVIVGDSENYILYFATFKESDLISIYDGCMTFEVTRKHTNEHKVIAHCISSTFVGIDEKCEYNFMDINPPNEVISDNCQNITATEKLETRSPLVQTAITDVFKERKRKLIDKNDTTQSKEKKKRDNNLLESFKSLKESLKKTADEIKIDVNKKSNVAQVVNMNSSSINTAILPNHDYLENQYQESEYVEDIELEAIDEEQFEDILSKIESEIKDTDHSNSVILGTKLNKQSNQYDQLTQFHRNKPIKYNSSRHTEPIKNMNKKNRNKINTKDNYTFLDILERKHLNEDNDNMVTKKETNFSETVKSQIQKFLQQAQEKFSSDTSNVDLLDSSNVIDKHSREIIDFKNYEISQNKDSTNNGDLVFVTDEKSTEKEQFHKTIESSNSPFCNEETPSESKLIKVKPNMKYKCDNKAVSNAKEDKFHETEEGLYYSLINNNLTNFPTKLLSNQTNQNHLDDNDLKSETNKTTKLLEINSRKSLKDSDDIIPMYNEIYKNNQYSLTKYRPLHTPSASKLIPDQLNMKYKSDNEATNNAEGNEFHQTEEGLNCLINNNMTNVSTKLLPSQTNRNHLDDNDRISETNITTNFHEVNSKELLKDSDDITICNELYKNKQYLLPTYQLLHRNDIAQDLPFMMCTKNGTQELRPVNREYNHNEEELGPETNSFFQNHQENPTSEEVEKINKYSFGQTKMFNVCTKNTSQQKVQIISKLQVGLDVTEIVYKKDEQSLISRGGTEIPRFDDNINFDAMETLNCQKGVSNNKVTSPDKLTKKVILHPCWSKEAKINLLNFEENKTVKLNCNFNERSEKLIALQNKTPLEYENKRDSDAILSGNTSKYYNLENSYLKDVLQNHRNMLARQKNIYESKAIYGRSKYETQNSNLVISETCTRMNKTRPIQEKIQIPLPHLFSIEKQNTACEKAITQHKNYTENIRNQNHKIEENPKEQNIIQMMNYSECASQHLDNNKNITEMCPQMPVLSEILYNINDCTDNGSYQDDDLVIPPPPEFCDDERHSTTVTNEDDKLVTENEQSLKINLADAKVSPDLSKKAQERIKGQDENRTSNTNQNEFVSQTNKNDAPLTKDKTTKSTSVKDILLKYSKIFKKQETKEIDTDNKETKNSLKIIQNNNIQDTEYTETNNYRRKYKIKDIPPPQFQSHSLPVGSLTTLPQKRLTQQNNLSEEIVYKKCFEIQNNRNIIDDNSYKIQQNNNINNTELVNEDILMQMPKSCINIEDEIEDEAPEILQPDVLLSQVSLADDNDLNQALFNPKTLLERMNKDNEEIIPGASEFWSHNTITYSPTYSNKYTEIQNTEAFSQDHDEVDQKAEEFTQNFEDLQNDSTINFNNVFENDSVVDLTPSKEVETWTLSQENAENRSFHTVTNTSYGQTYSFTTLRKNRTENELPKYTFSHNNARQAKLSYFKFEQKRRFYNKNK